jgi:hypothetical protein
MRAEGFRHLREKEASVFYQETLEDYRLVGSSAGHETDGLEALQCCRRTGSKRFQRRGRDTLRYGISGETPMTLLIRAETVDRKLWRMPILGLQCLDDQETA